MNEAAIRIDKWLWYARFFRSRTLAARVVADGRVRLNRRPVAKSHGTVKPGDVLTFPQARDIRVVRVIDCGSARRPAAEARRLYEDLAPPGAVTDPVAERERGGGRPTKARRRAFDKLRGSAGAG